jgi:hypothetical protein
MKQVTLGDALDKLRAALPPEMRVKWDEQDRKDNELSKSCAPTVSTRSRWSSRPQGIRALPYPISSPPSPCW